MKKSSYKSIIMLFVIMSVVFLAIILFGIGLLFSVITSTDPNGNSVLSNWPFQFTRDFAGKIGAGDYPPTVSDAGIKELDNNNLWLQIIDANGNEVYSHNTRPAQQTHYAPIELLELYQGEDNTELTVCVGTVEYNAEQWTYIIGFPMNISKVTMYLDGDSFTGGKSMLLILLSAAGLLMIVCGVIFGLWITRHFRRMTQAVGLIAYRLYEPIHSKGVFQDIYDSLNEMNAELLASDEEAARNEALREEWLTNITHDLKTPLSPIRGHAELLADRSYPITEVDRIEFGQVILKNAEYAEALVNDLKLTYQLKNGMIPLNMQQASLTRFLKESIIDMLNSPEYSDRNISFIGGDKEISCYFDERLLKRAINNLIMNALIHNTEDTVIRVEIQAADKTRIIIEDNGRGMDAEELIRLFQRYYRGTNTDEKAEGTGLGMAIAKQIIELHGGDIFVESAPDAGTSIIICFPLPNSSDTTGP